MRRRRLLDLFCGAGGAGMGYARAGFDVVGVDVVEQPRYPFTFVQADAMTFPLDGFDVIHASPPCQGYSKALRHLAYSRPMLVELIRVRLLASGSRYVIENVEGAPLHDPIVLCGTMFPGLRVIRHRLFESNVELAVPSSHPEHPLVFTHNVTSAHWGMLDQDTSFVTVTGGGSCTIANARDAMGIDWMTKPELNEALPPAYTEYIGRQLYV